MRRAITFTVAAMAFVCGTAVAAPLVTKPRAPRIICFRRTRQLLHRHGHRLPRVPEERDVAEPAPGRQRRHGTSLPVRHARECLVVELPRAGRGDGDFDRRPVTHDGAPLGMALRADRDDVRCTTAQHGHRRERLDACSSRSGPTPRRRAARCRGRRDRAR